MCIRDRVWFTRWRRSPDRTYSCEERIWATEAEVEPFAQALAELAQKEGFRAQLRAYDGLHV